VVPRALRGLKLRGRNRCDSNSAYRDPGMMPTLLGDVAPEMDLIGWIVYYLAMKRLRLKPTRQIELIMALAIIMVLAGLIYYGHLVWLLISPD
jgi:hypothetical protein